jgi:predicted SAM-dependent methyltransferase
MNEETLVRLDLGAGQNCRTDEKGKWIGVDIAPCEGIEVVHDLTSFPYPFDDNSVDEIFSAHFIEHLSGSEMIKFMEEVYRILKPAACATFLAPYYNNMRAMQDPTHKQFISEATFLYYNKQWREANKLDHYGISCDFDYSYAYHMEPYWAMREESARAFALKHFTNVVNDIQVTLVKK